MKLTIITTDVWEGEFDRSEFPHYVRRERQSVSPYFTVYEEIELPPNASVMVTESGAPGM